MAWKTNTKTGAKFNTDWIEDSRTLEDKYKHINPNYKKDSTMYDKEGFNNNCVKCAIAFEANMRGDDVEANPFRFATSEDIDKSKSIAKAFNQNEPWVVGRPKKEATIREIELMMTEDFGKGSRAIIQEGGGGRRHTMNVINDGGNVIVIDSQNGTHGSLSKMLKGIDTKSMILIRTDTQDISPDYSEWAYKRRKED